jgi:UrcA family protein
MKIALAAAALLASPQVCAFQAANGAQAVVSYADLNLARQRDRDRFAGRVDAAIDEVCGESSRHVTMSARIQINRCIDETTPAALAAMNAVLVRP